MNAVYKSVSKSVHPSVHSSMNVPAALLGTGGGSASALAIQDRAGGYILDRSGNYIESRV